MPAFLIGTLGDLFPGGRLLPIDSRQHFQPTEERQMKRREDSSAEFSGTGSAARASVIRTGAQKRCAGPQAGVRENEKSLLMNSKPEVPAQPKMGSWMLQRAFLIGISIKNSQPSGQR